VARLTVPDGGAVTLVAVVEPVRPVSASLLPSSIRGTVSRELAAFEAERTQHAQRALIGQPAGSSAQVGRSRPRYEPERRSSSCWARRGNPARMSSSSAPAAWAVSSRSSSGASRKER
jgi:hypothetical protein